MGKYSLAKIRSAARTLLTLEEKDHRRLFEGNALLRRLVRIGVLDEGRRISITCPVSKSKTSWSAVCKPRYSSSGWPNPSTTPVFSSDRGTSVLGSRWSTCPLSSSVWTPRSTSTSASSHHSAAVVPAASRGGTPRRDPAAETRRTRTKNNSIAVGRYSVVVADFHIGGGRPHQQPLLQCRRTQTSSPSLLALESV